VGIDNIVVADRIPIYVYIQHSRLSLTSGIIYLFINSVNSSHVQWQIWCQEGTQWWGDDLDYLFLTTFLLLAIITGTTFCGLMKKFSSSTPPCQPPAKPIWQPVAPSDRSVLPTRKTCPCSGRQLPLSFQVRGAHRSWFGCWCTTLQPAGPCVASAHAAQFFSFFPISFLIYQADIIKYN
jgi:hypothetical protein